MSKGKVFDLGRQGDGLIKRENKTVFIAGVLPDEIVDYEMTAQNRARLTGIEKSSPERAVPVCHFFEACGGCVLQHLKFEFYRQFKMRCLRELFPTDLVLPDFDAPVFIAPETRRRVTFALFWNGPVRRFGFNERQSNRIVETDVCPVLLPELEKLILPLREYLCSNECSYPKKAGTGDVFVQMTDTGADILLTMPFEPDIGWRQSVAGFAAKNGVARVSWRIGEQSEPEPLAVLHTPEIRIGDFVLKPPAGAFLQPSVDGQIALTEAVVEYVGKSKKVCDLFCGAGTFTLPLLQKKRKIDGFDNTPACLSALRQASCGRVNVQERDLFKQPLYPDELDGYDAVVFDPPRAGAKAQCEQIAVSGIKKVIAVSCNPVSFVRDAEILMKGGYRLARLRAVDQFVFTPHMELAALFEKD